MSRTRANDVETYTADLLLALRVRELPGVRIGEVLAEVESHVADTGEDPYEAFGSPRQYAQTIAPARTGAVRRDMFGQAVLGAVAGWLLARGTFSLVSGEDTLYGLPVLLVLALGIGAAVAMVVFVRRRSATIVDPRSGRQLAPSSARATAILLVVMTLAVAVVAVLTISLG
jgi:hypothetical protein